jgi:hypothetical protein
MIRALAFLQYHSVKNRLLVRLRRLRKPKYLVGGIVGAIYFWFYFFRPVFASRRGGSGPPAGFALTPESLPVIESIGAVAILAILALAWIVPHQRAALLFSEPEIAFLFPAPVNRRGLIHYKLLRSQIGIFFSTLILAVLTRRYGAAGTGWIRAAGWWVILSTLNLHFLGSSFALTRWMDLGLTTWKRRWLLLGIAGAGVAAVALWIRATVPPPHLSELNGAQAIVEYVRAVCTAGPLPYLLWPARIVVRPYLAADGLQFILALLPALCLIVLHYFWVIHSNVAFEEASVALSEKRAQQVAAIRSGDFQNRHRLKKRGRPPFVLRPTGWPLIALLWKNLISAGTIFTVRTVLILVYFSVFIFIGLGVGAGKQQHDWTVLVSMFIAMALGVLILIGPQIMRQDLRRDLNYAEILKVYPLRGWQIVLGELLTPAVILTLSEWFLLFMAVGLFSRLPSGGIPLRLRVAFGISIAVLIPFFNVLSLLIPNAAVLVFPGWFLAGREGFGGIEATGQRIIFFLGQIFVFAVALVPAAFSFAVVFLVTKLFLPWLVALPLGSFAAALALAAEAALGLSLLGPVFERLDLSEEAVK